MGITVISKDNTQIDQKSVVKRRNKAFALLRTWELYPILFIAASLRLYRIDTVLFVDDQAVVFSMARDAIVHGLWPITSNRASLGILNFPLVVYLFMLPAAISSNPLWAEVMVGLLNTIAVLLAYLFVRRYYGRLAGTIVALFYATCMMCYLPLSCSFYSACLGELLNDAGDGSSLLSCYSGCFTSYTGVHFCLLVCCWCLAFSLSRQFAGMRFFLLQYCSGLCAPLTYFGNGKAIFPI